MKKSSTSGPRSNGHGHRSFLHYVNSRIGHSFEWAVFVTQLRETDAVSQQKPVRTQVLPLDHLNEFVKMQWLALEASRS